MRSRVINRYMLREFFTLFVPIVLTFMALYLIIDFFDRLDMLLRHGASPLLACRYFVFKIPLIVTQVTPPAVLAAVLLSFGSLSRRNEIIALRALGVSLGQTAVPVLAIAGALSALSLVWDETVVPYCSRQFQYVNVVEIRKRPLRGLLNDREIWYHGRDGFYNIDHIDAQRQTLHGLTIYRLDPSFALTSVVEVPTVRWEGMRWHASAASERRFSDAGQIATRRLAPDQVAIPETLEDFLEVRREPEELSFTMLRQRIAALVHKGIDTSSYLVDLHLKLAVPCASFVLALVGVPLAGRVRRRASIAGVVAVGLGAGFAYWVVLALANSLGHGGVLPAVVAAWAANVVFALIGVALFLGQE